MGLSDLNAFLLVLAGAITATLTILGAFWWVLRPRWDEAVLRAAERRRMEWKVFFANLFEAEMRVNADTHERARRTHEIVERHVNDFNDFRREVQPRIADMVIFTKTVADLDVSVRELNKTLKEINQAHQLTREEVAELRGQLGGA